MEFDRQLRYKEKFMLESNRIEGEDRLNPGDISAINMALRNISFIDEILIIHKMLGDYLKKDWVGKFRTCNVRVGSYIAPDYKEVKRLMEKFMLKLPRLDSWTAHNRFQEIHPFQDLNGRVGRLIWLSKAYKKEEYNFEISFLHKYYYQTLVKYHK